MDAKNALEDSSVNMKLKLAALWTSFMFLYIYIDYFHLYMPHKLEEILKGRVFEFAITEGFLLMVVGFMMIPVSMIFLSVLLPAKLNRWTNIIIAAIHIPYMLFNLAGEAWAHMYVAAALEVVLLVLIIRNAWKWPRSKSVYPTSDF